MKHIDIRPHDFERTFLRHEIGYDDQMVYGMRIDIFMDRLILNYTYPDPDLHDAKDYPRKFLVIDLKDKTEGLLEDKALKNDAQYGERFHLLHGYRHLKSFDKHMFVTRAAKDNNIIVYDEDFKPEFGFSRNSVKFVDSDASNTVVAFISRKGNQRIFPKGERPDQGLPGDEDHKPNQDLPVDGYGDIFSVLEVDTMDELFIMNQRDADKQEFHKLCRTTRVSEMVSVACAKDYIYLLEFHKFDVGQTMDDRYSIYTINPDTGKRVGRADIALYNGRTSVTEDTSTNVAFEYFDDNLDGGHGKAYYGDESLYQPHEYHENKKLVKVGSPTSCNTAMPCSQYIESEYIKKILEKEELYIEVLGIDSIGGTNIAISYVTYGGGYQEECDVIGNKLGVKYYNIDIIDMSHRDEEFAYDTLNLSKFNTDYHKNCVLKQEWILDRPEAISGKLVTCTDKYIAVPVILRPIEFDENPHVESAIVLFDKKTHAYVSYIKLGKDYHKDDTTVVLHPNRPPICHEEDEEYPTIPIKMDVAILDIDSDCSQIAVTYVMKYAHHDHKVEHFNVKDPISQYEFQIYTEVFTDINADPVCRKRIIPLCDVPKSRDWQTGNSDQKLQY